MSLANEARADPQPLIAEFKGLSLDDGPGIRSVIFFKGCPLACIWCHNPEMKKPGAELAFDPGECVGSRRCLQVCEAGALDVQRADFIDRARCTLCFRCAEVCPAEAFQRVGRAWQIEELLEAVARYLPFYRRSQGGVTLSGGEPTLFMEYSSVLAKSLHSRGIHTLLETCGFFAYERYERLLAPFIDQVYFDLKLVDPGFHRRYCGRDNELILENFCRLQRRYLDGGTPLLARVPLIPGITATAENLATVANFLFRHQVKRVALLPYNPLWIDKASKLGHTPLGMRREWMAQEALKDCSSYFTDFELV